MIIWAALALNNEKHQGMPVAGTSQPAVMVLGSQGQKVLVGDMHKMQCCSQVLWDQYVCLGNDALAAGAMQVCKTLPDKHPDYSTLCLLWPDVVLLYLPALCSLSHLSPQLFFSLSCSLRQLPCAFPSLSLVNQTPLPQAPKPCIAARLYRATSFQQERLSSAAFPGYFTSAKGGTDAKGNPD